MRDISDIYSNFIYKRTYSRWDWGKGRREQWEETVDRYFNFFRPRVPESLLKTFEKAKEYVVEKKVMPSMRCLWSAGEALEKDNIAGYNCAYTIINRPKAFSEMMYILMNGTGCGFSVERQYVNEMPMVPATLERIDDPIVVEDSKRGWAEAYELYIDGLYNGQIRPINYSKVRPEGAILKTFGGRASGPEPLKRLVEFTEHVFQNAKGRKLNSLECHDIACFVASIVVVGGVRRSATISLSNLSDLRMRDAKQGQFWETAEWRMLANNSTAYTEKPEMAIFIDEWARLMESQTGERGIFNREAAERVVANAGRREHRDDFGCNPCVTGDTLVYVADGRGEVSFKDLAEEGEDVPVFCLDEQNKVTVRMMMNPRKTGIKKPVYKILFDDGMSIISTENHKFKMKDGSYRQLIDVCAGDSVEVLSKFNTNTHFGQNDDKKLSKAKYTFLQCGSFRKSEHNVIAEFKYGESLPKRGCVIHHRDFNSLNNAPDNLVLMDSNEHRSLHADRMKGVNNPMVRAKCEWSDEKWRKYKEKQSKNNSGVNNSNYNIVESDVILDYAFHLAKSLGRRFSNDEWIKYAKKHSLPLYFTKWRLKDMGIENYTLPNWIAYNLGYLESNDADLKTIRKYHKLLSEGYDVFIENRILYFNKKCEYCGQEIITRRKSISYCSNKCALKSRADFLKKNETTRHEWHASLMANHKKRKEFVRSKQLDVYFKLNNELHREPFKSEWVTTCKKQNISIEISRPSSPFRSWDDLKQRANQTNHKVVSVEFAGYEDVYNGNVEEVHNFFIGGQNKKGKTYYFNTLNCSEIILRPNEFCNLSEVVVRYNDTLNDLTEKVKYATILGMLQSTLTDFNYLDESWKKNCEEERLLGVSLTGVMDHPVLSNEKKAERLEDWLTAMKDTAIRVAEKWSRHMGINMPAAITAVKPSGTVSQLVNSSSGLHPRHSEYYIRRVRVSKTDPMTQFLIDKGVPHNPEVKQGTLEDCSTVVFDFPTKTPSKRAVYRHDKTALQQLDHWMLMQRHWCEHKPSMTVYVRDDEWLEVGAWVYKNFGEVSGISFLPFEGGLYQLAPYQEITEEEYRTLIKNFPKAIDFEELIEYEKEDYTIGSQELACSGGQCDLAL